VKTYLVKFDIGGGWFIECQMRGLDAQHAEALAEHSLRRRFIQWGGQTVSVTSKLKSQLEVQMCPQQPCFP
jgi:hypothetical protein